MLMALVPVLAWVMAGVWWFLRGRTNGRTLREGLLVASLWGAGWVVVGTEGLGAFSAIGFWSVLLWWVGPVAVFCGLLWKRRREIEEWTRVQARLLPTEWGLLGIVLVCLAWSGLQAGMSAPATPDSVSYHLPRQLFWAQQGSVAFYSTSNLRQLMMPPLAEYAGLHLMVLTGSDGAHNFVQWLAYGMTMAAVSLIVKRYGGNRTAQLLSAVWVATIPMAFLQASNTKNDMATALWVAESAYFVLKFDEVSRERWEDAVWVGLGFGALLLTKGTGMIFGLPLAIVWVGLLARKHLRQTAGMLAAAAGIVIAMNGPFLWRNYAAFGSPVPQDARMGGGDVVGNEVHSAAAVVSNMVRTVAPHLALPNSWWNAKLTEGVRAIHGWLGIDVNDPRTTYKLGQFGPYVFLQDENLAVAPVHLVLALIMAAAVGFRWRRIPGRVSAILLGIVVAGFILFCFVLKWQVWHPRLVVALPVLLAPVFGWVMTSGGWQRGMWWAVGLLILGLLPSMNTERRALFGGNSLFLQTQEHTRYVYDPRMEEVDQKLVEMMAAMKPRVIGLEGGWTSDFYLFQRMMVDRLNPVPRFVSFNGAFQVKGGQEEDPDVVIGYADAQELVHASTGRVYRRVGRVGPYVVYR